VVLLARLESTTDTRGPPAWDGRFCRTPCFGAWRLLTPSAFECSAFMQSTTREGVARRYGFEESRTDPLHLMTLMKKRPRLCRAPTVDVTGHARNVAQVRFPPPPLRLSRVFVCLPLLFGFAS